MSDADGAGLLAAIIANPADDVPRLIYADWMEDNGHTARARWIRVGMAFRQQIHAPPWHYTPWEGQHRVVKGLPEYVMPDDWSRFVWHRGFVAYVKCPLAAWQTHGPALVRAHPVTRVELSDREPANEYGGWTWHDDDDEADDCLPPEVCERMEPRGDWVFSSLGEARSAASAALLKWAKAQ